MTFGSSSSEPAKPAAPAKKPAKKEKQQKPLRGHSTVPTGAAEENRRKEAEEAEEE